MRLRKPTRIILMTEILMFGPPKGHNIKLYLDFFQKYKNEFKLTYFYSGKKVYSFEPYTDITFVHRLLNILAFLSVFKKTERLELIWIHNWTPVYVILILLFLRRKSKIVFSVWSEPIPRMTLGEGIKAKTYRFIFKKMDFIQCLWFPTYELMKRINSNPKVVLFPWGLSESYFKHSHDTVYSQETIEFVDSLESNKINFFWPKSISGASRHDIVIESCKQLREAGVLNFKVYFWLGNAVKRKLYYKLERQIAKFDLSTHVIFVHHSFLTFNEIRYIWSKMDVGLQIAAHDALSTSFLEPLFLKKPVVVSKIAPYQIFESHFNLKLDLVELNPSSLKNHMLSYIQGREITNAELNKRSEVISTYFNFEKNTLKAIEYFAS
ncbi:MAG: hypothetical protein RH916_01610 [Vicingaceae bacterium]